MIKRKFLVKKNPGSSGMIKTYYIEEAFISDIVDTRIKMEESVYSISKYKQSYKLIINSNNKSEVIEISRATYIELLNNAKGHEISKIRKTYQLQNGLIAKWDKFQNPIDLQIVTVDFNSKDEADIFIPPNWFGEEITDNPEYFNYSLKNK